MKGASCLKNDTLHYTNFHFQSFKKSCFSSTELESPTKSAASFSSDDLDISDREMLLLKTTTVQDFVPFEESRVHKEKPERT